MVLRLRHRDRDHSPGDWVIRVIEFAHLSASFYRISFPHHSVARDAWSELISREGVRAFRSSAISVLGQFRLSFRAARARERSDLRARPRGTRTKARSIAEGRSRVLGLGLCRRTEVCPRTEVAGEPGER